MKLNVVSKEDHHLQEAAVGMDVKLKKTQR